ncbi:MAG: chondroitinase family polysaccharide lyase [Bacteroidales bacterium]
MKHHIHFSLLIFFQCFLSLPKAEASVISFENGLSSGWSTLKGNFFVSDKKVKLGNHALCWEWQANDLLKLANHNEIQTSSQNTNGGISMWIYNTTSSPETLHIRFRNDAGVQCTLPFKLNFTGWRYLLAEYGNDMGLPKQARGSIHTFEIVAPAIASGHLYFDCLEFQNKISWERMSNFQFAVKENAGTDSYLTPRQNISLKEITPDENQRKGFDTILKRIDNWYLGTNNHIDNPYLLIRKKAIQSYIKKGVEAFPKINANGTLNASGLFGHSFHGATIDNIQVNTFRQINETCLLQLAYDYRLNGNKNSLDKLHSLYDWFYDQGWADGSALGTLRFEMLRSAGFHHSFMLTANNAESRLDRLVQAEAWFSRFGDACSTPENPGELADYLRTLALPKLFYALQLQDESKRVSALTAYRDYMDNAMSHAHGYLGSLKEDGSGYHHRGPYFSAYYPDVLYAGCLIYYLLHDTPFAMSKQSFSNLKNALLSFRFICADYRIPGSVTGRFPAQTEVLQQILPAYAYLIGTSEDEELTGTFLDLWHPDESPLKDYIGKARTDICLSTTIGEIEIMLNVLTSKQNLASRPEGIRYMPYSGMLVARNQDWLISIKGFSKYIWDFESSATENPYGRYQSYGQIEYNSFREGYNSYQIDKNDAAGKSEWDWRLLNGTTTRYIPTEELHFSSSNKHRNFSDQTFLGGIGFDDTNGMFSLRLHDREISGAFYADKSVFIAGNEILCLGSNIQENNNRQSLTTTLFQHKLNDNPILLDGKIITGTTTDSNAREIKDNFNNYYFIDGGNINLQKNNTSWAAYINHGNNLPAEYAYTWLIGANDEQINAIRGERPWQIILQNNIGHAAYHKTTGIMAAAFFKSDLPIHTGLIRKVSKPMLAMYRCNADGSIDLSLSDPDMNRPGAANNDKLTDAMVSSAGIPSDIWIELEGEFSGSSDYPIKTEITQGYTRITVPQAKDGKTYSLKLEQTITNIDGNISAGDYGLSHSDHSFRITGNENIPHEWFLYASDGILVETGTDRLVNLKRRKAGVYLLKIKNKSAEITFKIIR